MMFWKRNNAKGIDDIREEPTPTSGGRPKLKAAFTEELRMSVYNLEEATNKNKSQGLFALKSPFRGGRRPTMSKEQQDELRASVHTLTTKREQKGTKGAGISASKSPSQGRRLTLSKEQQDELRASAHNIRTRREQQGSNGTGTERRTTLSKAMAEELRTSFHEREASNQSRREKIKTRRESRSQLYPHSIREERESDTDSEDRPPRRALKPIAPKASEERPRLRPELFNELRKSIHSRSTRDFDRRQQIKDRIMKRRESQRILPLTSAHSIDSSTPSFAEMEDIPLKSAPKRVKNEKKGLSWDHSQHSADTFASASFSDLGASSDRLALKSTDVVTSRSMINDEKPPADLNSLRVSWTILDRQKKRLTNESAVNEKNISILTQQVNDLRAEGTDLRKQLSNWQDKASAISKGKSQDRIKFENSTDLIAKARVELTKTLNENSALKTKIHELELGADDRQRRIQSLNENIASQSGRITTMSAELKDTQAELRYNIDEKRRVDEELAVIIASRDGKDIGETIRRLEQDRAQWLEEKERTLEAKRIALDEENDRVLQREKRKYREEAEQLIEISEKSRDREMEQERLHGLITKQLSEMKEANEDLRDKLQQEHMENRVETKKKDHSIALLEQEVSKLRRKLAASQLREQDNEARLVEIENNNDELRYVKKQNSLLEKQIRKLKKEKPSQRPSQRPSQKGGEDWKEIILPGYKNMRGVTFGSPSEELAGFLTILVEDQKAKESEVKSNLQKEIRKYLKEYKGKNDAIDKRGNTKGGKKKSKTAKKKKRSAKLKKSSKPKSSKGQKRRNSFTDIEDYDWDVKPKKVKRHSKRDRRVDEHSDGDSRVERRAKKSKSRKERRVEKYSDDDSRERHRLKKRQSKRERSVEKYSEDDSRGHRRSKRHKKVTKRTKRKRKKMTSGKRKPSKHGKERRTKRSGGRRISRHAAREEDSERIEELDEGNPDDVSLVVMKRAHKKKQSSRPRLRLPPVTPPEIIVLQ